MQALETAESRDSPESRRPGWVRYRDSFRDPGDARREKDRREKMVLKSSGGCQRDVEYSGD